MGADVLKKARLVSGMTASDMSMQMHRSRPTLLAYERDISRATVRDVLQWYEAVDETGKRLIADQFADFFSKSD